jgi:hypothetical protein
MSMQLSPIRKQRLAAATALLSISFMVYMLSDAGPVGPAYRDENLTAGPEPFMMVRVPSVREELKITEAQLKKIQEASGQQGGGIRQTNGQNKGQDKAQPAPPAATAPRAARMGREHQEAFLKTVLQPEQVTRLRQIILQRQGGLALANSRTADELNLTESQRQKVDGVVDKLAQQPNRGRNLFTPEGRKAAEEARKAAGDELLALLTPEQENRWKELTGAPFTGEITFGPPGGGWGGPQGAGGAAGGGRGGRQGGGPGGAPGGPPAGAPPAPPGGNGQPPNGGS